MTQRERGRLVKGPRGAEATTLKRASAYLESEFPPWWNDVGGARLAQWRRGLLATPGAANRDGRGRQHRIL